MKTRNLFIILLSLLFAESTAQQVSNKSIHLKISNPKQEFLPGVYIIQNSTGYLLGTTDHSGECLISVENMDSKDTIRISTLGYHSRFIPVADLSEPKTIVLQEKQFLLAETTIQGIRPQHILKKAAARLKNHPKSVTYNQYGRAQYMKITECKNKAVELRREYGYFFTTGNTKRKGKWDLGYKFSFIPEYSARSYNMEPDGSDTLRRLFMYGSVRNYNAGNQKIFSLLRAVLSFGPLFTSKTDYRYHLIEYDQDNYVFAFQTRKEKFPSSTRIFCNGTLTISQGFLKKIHFENIDYNLLLLTNLKKATPPFQTQADITIDYDSQNYPYISSCVQTTTWKHNTTEKFTAIEMHSRLNPAKNYLQEKEAFASEYYRPVPTSLRKRLDPIIRYASINPTGKYDSTLFHQLPLLLPTSAAIQELNRYMDIEQQLKNHHNKPYYPEQYILQYLHQNEDEQFLELIKQAKKKIFQLFKNSETTFNF